MGTAINTATLASVDSSTSAAVLSVLFTSPAHRVCMALDQMADRAEAVQSAMVALIEGLPVNKKLVQDDAGLAMVFGHSFKGVDRSKLVTWVQTYTPIRIRFHENGGFKDIKWSEQHIKECKESGRDVFDLANMKSHPWYEGAPTPSKPAAEGSFEKIMKSLERMVARAAYDEGVSVEQACEKLAGLVRAQLAEKATAYMVSEKHVEWVERRADDKKKAARVEGQAKARLEAAKGAMH